jgi:hypothetical protein
VENQLFEIENKKEKENTFELNKFYFKRKN